MDEIFGLERVGMGFDCGKAWPMGFGVMAKGFRRVCGRDCGFSGLGMRC